MTNDELPIPIYKLAFLQSYLYQVFSLESHCENSFKNTEWYLKGKFSEAEIRDLLNHFLRLGLKCDCDIINKLDLKIFTSGKSEFHH